METHKAERALRAMKAKRTKRGFMREIGTRVIPGQKLLPVIERLLSNLKPATPVGKITRPKIK